MRQEKLFFCGSKLTGNEKRGTFDLKKVLLKPSPQLEFTFSDGDG